MHDLKSLELSDLLDLLIEYTAHHTKMIATRATPEEFRISRETLRELQTEIKIRQARDTSTPNDMPPGSVSTAETQTHK